MNITLIPGDGIGVEVSTAARNVIEATGVDVRWDVFADVGQRAVDAGHEPLPRALLDAVVRDRVALKGPLTTPIGEGFASINVGLRKALDLYANVRPVRSLPNIHGKYPAVDLILVRENTEDLYSGIEHVVAPGVVESIKVITERASTRIARYAFALAAGRARRRVTAVHKANIMKLTDGLFLDCARAVAKQHPGTEYKEMIVDNAGMQLVLDPGQFDILLLPNLYGDILSDVAAGLVGGLGLAPAANVGEGCAIFEAVHGSAPDIAGKGIANPTALILAGAMMLRHLERAAEAQRIEAAVHHVFRHGQVRTRDLGGKASTEEFTRAVIAEL
ncbi:MAG: isocitrate/isopropylmalate dehydrogenase family protein [Planctomycetota bacterium]